MAISISSLPMPLILLVHLHILEYPHANKPEYDHNIFDARVRGLRERTKLMEDVCYFLVGRLEGGKDGARTILSTYPCIQPSDSVAFRTSLSKYLEALRHKSIYPTSKPLPASAKTKCKDTTSEVASPVAWWWKEVVVRKSLLEECTGEKFERLLLSMSTHTLLKTSAKSGLDVKPENTINLLQAQPLVYTDLLSKHQSSCHVWTRSASQLLKRQEDLKSLRETLHDGSFTSKYDSLSTERLLALAQSKLHELVQHSWLGKEGQHALQFLADTAGVKTPTYSNAGVISLEKVENGTKDITIKIPPQPLPVAAAHHPSHLRRLRRPLFPQEKTKGTTQSSAGHVVTQPSRPASKSHAEITLSDRLERERKMHRALAVALSRTRKVGEELTEKMHTLLKSGEEKGLVQAAPMLELWMPEPSMEDGRIHFETQVTSEFLEKLSLSKPEVEGALEARIDHIRESLLPAYPPTLDPAAAARPPPEEPPAIEASSCSRLPQLQTRIPRTNTNPASKTPPASMSGNTIVEEFAFSGSSHAGPAYLALSPLRELVTSTPPPTVKPRSAQLQGIMSTHKSGRRNSRMPRKSIRFSLAVTRRPSLFPAAEGSGDEMENEVSRIIYGTQDESTEEPFSAMTPKSKPKPVNRIYTAGTPRPKSSAKKPKQSYPMALLEPAFPLPSLISSSSSFSDMVDAETDDEWADEGLEGVEPMQTGEANEDGDTSWDEVPSMTLRDILLKTDTTQFDLLEDGPDDDGLLEESFEWE